MKKSPLISASEALKRLRDGNHRFVSEVGRHHRHLDRERRESLVAGQAPFAVVLGCADSRVPPELIFDQGLGDLFVIRVAGNVAPPSAVGSVEFAAAELGTRLVVVLGHSNCGAVGATVDAVRRPSQNLSPNLKSIVDRVRPSVKALLETESDTDTLIEKAVRANVRASVDHLRHGSKILERLIDEEDLLVAGAEYALETGEVDFFEGGVSRRVR